MLERRRSSKMIEHHMLQPEVRAQEHLLMLGTHLQSKCKYVQHIGISVYNMIQLLLIFGMYQIN